MANAYFTCELDAWRSGTTLYARMRYRRTDGATYTYQDPSFPNPTMDLAGTTFTDTGFGDRVRAGINVGDVYTTQYSRTVAGSGDRTVTFTAGSGQRSDFAGSWSKTVNFPEQYTPPTGLSVSVVEKYTDGAKFSVSISSYGNPSSASGRYIEAGILGENWYGIPYRYTHGDSSTSAQIVVNNSSPTGSPALTIQPNTQYYYGGFATNTQENTSTVQGTFVTLAVAPTITPSVVTDTSATFDYLTSADGNQYAKDIQYSLDGGTTWVTAATVSTGSATSGTFTISGLTADTRYTMQTRVSTTSGITNGQTITFIAKDGLVNAFYGPSNSLAVKTTKMYGSVNGKTRGIMKLYGSVNGKTKRVL